MAQRRDRNGNKLKVGDRVIWFDPDPDAINTERVWDIYDINGDIVCISDEFSEAEVFACELELVADKTT